MSEFDDWADEQMKDPEFRAAYEEASARMDRSIQRPCSEGCCVEFYDPESGEVEMGWGPVGCACQD
jgi:hypothetical protein